MSARDRSSQNETSTSTHNVTDNPQSAGGPVPTSSSSSSVAGGGMESQLAQPQPSPLKANIMGSGDGELVKLADNSSIHTYTPHSSPVPPIQATPVAAEVTPNSTPSSSPRRPLSLSSEPPAKRIKIEEKPTDSLELRKVIIEWKNNKLESVKEKYNSHIVEKYFLENVGNLMDYQNWCRRPPREFLNYVRQHKLEGDESLEVKFTTPSPFQLSTGVQIKTENTLGAQSSPSKANMGNLAKTSTSPVKPGKGLTGVGGRQKTLSTSENPSSVTSHQDQMVEKARQEAYVVQRIAALRKEGLWSEKRLPKVHEPPRPKAHWDYLLEEMVWLSADFAQERKWKKAAAKKCARMVQKYFLDKALQAQKEEKEKEMRTRKIAAFIAKEVRTFWGNTEKFIHFKITTKLDEKKKKALDQQLSFIVDQTEKYSSMLAESMNKPAVVDSAAVSTCTTPSQDARMSDEEFQPEESSDDDEATIAKEDDNPEEQESELQLLQKESEQTIEDLLKDLPEGYFQEIQQSCSNSPEQMSEEETREIEEEPVAIEEKEEKQPEKTEKKGKKRKAEFENMDEDFKADESGEDDENTIEEEEAKEGEADHEKEIAELEAENEMSVEELRKKYEELAANAEPMEKEESEDESSVEDGEESEDEGVSGDDEKEEGESEDEEEEEEEMPSDEEEEDLGLGLETLMEEDLEEPKRDREKADKELQDATAAAEALQPKGFTLSSTSVTTPIPFLLKHMLREYQHVGLDWLTTMYDKRLNGILADEMGLGKTIQTIALLAHLACEKRNWGPHLIVVPTSVMLNWEMEFKKWCPAFKILTYYGTQKERKMKRQGWTKPNAFHICITSYKLVIQDHQSFRRKKWKYFILDEAQNIKNFKSQRWQLLLNFQSQRRLLLTGTPLQNNLMELWSLMHFLMPNVFASHREFREWFSNPVTGMIEGNKEYNENIIKRLHKVLRPFILRRLKSEVEQQMPKKFEHVVMCRLSKRQRYLYEEFMSRTKTKETLASGNFLSVINVLMQLRKVCNHPNLFEARPTISPFMMESIQYDAPSIVYGICDYDPFKHIDLFSLNLLLSDLELCLTAFAAHRIRKFQASRRLIEEIDSASDPPPKCPAGKIKLHVRPSSQSVPKPPGVSPVTTPRPPPVTGAIRPQLTPTPLAAAPTALQASGGVRFHLVQQGGTIKAIQVPASGSNIGSLVIQQTPQGPRLMVPQRANIGSPAGTATVGTASPSGGLQLLQTASGQLLLTTAPVQKPATPTLSQGISGTAAAALLQRLQGLKGLQGSTITTGAGGRPVLRLPLPANTLRPHTQVISGAQSVASPLRTQAPAPTPAPVVSTPAPTPVPITAAVSNVVRPSTPAVVPRTSAPNTPTKPTTRTEQREAERQEEKRKDDERKRSLFFLNDLEERKKKTRKEKLSLIARLNIRRCHACPIYGADLIEAVTVIGNIGGIANCSGNFCGQGIVNCLHATSPNPRAYWAQTDMLHQVVYTPEKCLKYLKDITDRFIFVVPSVLAPPIVLRVCHPPPSKLWQEVRQRLIMKKELAPYITPLHHILNASVTQFPDPRLIQYDCGKLQTLDRLLRQLKSGSHRVLIFTQMTKMLDVFEAFLNYHGHLYLRLDGTTRVEQRQVLMERFNQDKRIFAFILSTRSGGIGVNLTGADTVIFYDSDWNPTMDAQAQDRCHRIGQTRDVHIYRLISEKTIEENILKKANQKRLLGDLAIEGGNFTTAHFKKSTIQDLFDVNDAENDAAKRMSEVLEKKPSIEEGKEVQPPEGERVVGAFESALAAAEDETDVQAAKIAKAEAAAELAEFDETLPLNEEDREGGQELSKAEQEVAMLMKQLTPIELYALKFLESREDYQAEAERMSAEIEQQKKEWELGRLQALKEEEERLAQSSDEDLLSYASTDAHNQMWLSLCGREEMPIWHPPTPPRDENDLYIDHSLGFWYDPSIMPESALPPFYIKKEHKRIKIEPGTGALASDETVGLRRVQKHRREDAVYAPRSLFDRPSPAIVKIRQALKHQKYRGIVRPSIPLPGLKPSLLTKPPVAEPENAPEWTVNEDWAVVQALQQHLQVELPINLLVLSPGHTPNWDLVADLVNSVSRCFRSARHCRARYESTILPREEGKLPPDTPTKKISKKQKSGILSKPLHKNSRPMRTSHLFKEDNNSTYSGLYSSRFETIKSIAIKRTPTTKPPLINSTHKNPKHAQVLLESGIQYDNPLNPGQVAANLAERIQRAKQKSQAAAELAQQQKLLQQQQQLQLQQAQITANQLQHHVQQQTQSQSQTQATQQQQGQQAQQQVSVVGSSAVQQVVSSGLTTKVATSVVLSQGTAMTVATVTATTSASTPATSTAAAAILSGVRTAVGTTGSATAGRPTLSLQELQVRTPGTVVTVASLTPAQLNNAKITATLATPSSNQKGRPLTPAQLQYLKQQAQQARQALTLQHQQQGKVVSADQTIKRVQIGGQSGTTQKVQVAVSGGSIAGVNPIQVSQAGRTQLVKPGTVVAGTSGVMATGKVTCTMTDREVAALFKQQQLSKTGQMAQVQVPSAQLLAGLQVQGGVSGGGTPVPTLVKTVSAPSTLVHTPTCVTLPVSAINVTLPQARVSTAATVTKAGNTQQTVRNIPLQQQILAKQRSLVGVKGPVGLQLGSKTVGSSQLSTVQIVQGSGQKQMSHVTMQQIQQVLKQVPQQSIQHITQGGTVSGTVVGKAVAGGSVAGTSVATSGSQGITTSHTTKLIPMTVSSQQQQSIKQTIQVVSAGGPGVAGASAIRVSAGERSSASTLALQSGSVKVTNPILSQVSAALQPMSVAVRNPTQSPVRIQTSALQAQQTTQTQQQPQQQSQQGQQQTGGNGNSSSSSNSQ
ncbi:helicase domino-like isoform X2 [Palaemon carinicauda]|uniref:helicase domino-like isoform X2 n=1 Tax=Palaemon carinicauda TaxID=392227 RepID=UPI0035B618F8